MANNTLREVSCANQKAKEREKKKNANGIYINQVIRVYVELIALAEFWAAFLCDILHLNSKKKEEKKKVPNQNPLRNFSQSNA